MKLPKKITKQIGEELSPEDIDALNKSAQSIQPDLLPPRSTNAADLAANTAINAAYKILCDNNISFVLCGLLPESKEERLLYRTCEIKNHEDGKKSQELMGRILYSLYLYMDFTNFVDYLESCRIIKALKRVFSKIPQSSGNAETSDIAEL